MPKHRPNIERLSAPALIGELAEHIRLGKVKVSEALVAAGIPKIKLQNAPSGGDITLFYDGDIAALSSIACRKYRQLARDLDFALPSFELSWDDVPLNYYTRTIDALPYKDFMCVVSTPDTDRIYHFSGSANGSCQVLGFEKQTGDWTMLPCDLLIAEDLTFKIPSIHDGVDHWWSQSQLALELLAIINAPTKTISLPPLDERTRRMNDQRRLRNSRLIKQTHKIILHKVVVKADGLPDLLTPTTARGRLHMTDGSTVGGLRRHKSSSG